MTKEWTELIMRLQRERDPLLPLVALLADDPWLGRLYPFTSHYALGLSYKPYDRGWDVRLPYAFAKDDGEFELLSGDDPKSQQFVAKGSPERILAVLIRILPLAEGQISEPKEVLRREADQDGA